ncbi:aromatic-ring-hydroxylating dioxygenase subunit beta [Pseudoalteromonas sp. MB41]|uniref:aromatic-ring-hydroxylating dioxygenase subunit beta n=1 Tax=Pseudoalteromonas sp. MB41 TaxID=2896366 RepID=UPI001E540EEC|nr:aromatic-ring-hydroxylating dioxygenase subunit beta [Pseudoalteromonas sp. MB41]MCC9659222.1 aromatic-ring-hydroxylating dioxygenase subunit beta [Pseudoalteromonas sp. MB41]
MGSYTKLESQLIVVHSIKVAERRGESQAEICEEFDIDPSLLSRAKKGERKLQNETLDMLTSHYGRPNSLAAGIYIKAEKLNTTSEFKKSYNLVNDILFAQKLNEVWCCPAFLKTIQMILLNNDAEPYDELNLKSQLHELLADEAFKEWFDLYEPQSLTFTFPLSQKESNIAYQGPSLKEILALYKIHVATKDEIYITFFQRLGHMAYGLCGLKEFNFENTVFSLKNLPIEEEYVIRGSSIMNLSGQLKNKKLLDTYKFFKQYSLKKHLNCFPFSYPEAKVKDRTEYDSSLNLSEYSLTIYQTNNLEYYAEIKIFDTSSILKTQKRKCLVKLDGTKIIEDLMIIFKALNIEDEIDKQNLKIKLAEVGASLPGVISLD